ncbi:hypothetical protein ArsFIN_00890 [Arsenophonus nasoniae]|uniref:Uncharacterized protein n=1 Tax=Arsenophonus nasoniae TaxID=638 RepID=A0A4P7KP34_9GAMM|nr:hypothetical protein ArsFIN_00890 [Arsenophonus nasoniae]
MPIEEKKWITRGKKADCLIMFHLQLLLLLTYIVYKDIDKYYLKTYKFVSIYE